MGMLGITLRKDEKVLIDFNGTTVEVVLGKRKGQSTVVLFKGPREVKIAREAYLKHIQEGKDAELGEAEISNR